MGISHSKRSVDITTTAKAPKEEQVVGVTSKGDVGTTDAATDEVTNGDVKTNGTNGSVEESDVKTEASEETENAKKTTEGEEKESKLTNLKKKLNFSFMKRRASTKEEKTGEAEASTVPEEKVETKEVVEVETDKNLEEVKETVKEVKESKEEGTTASEEGSAQEFCETSAATKGGSAKTVSKAEEIAVSKVEEINEAKAEEVAVSKVEENTEAKAEEVAVSKAEGAAVTEVDEAPSKEGVTKETVAIVEEVAIKEEVAIPEKEETIVSEKEETTEVEMGPSTGEMESKEVGEATTSGEVESKEVGEATTGEVVSKDLNVTYEVRKGEVSGE